MQLKIFVHFLSFSNEGNKNTGNPQKHDQKLHNFIMNCFGKKLSDSFCCKSAISCIKYILIVFENYDFGHERIQSFCVIFHVKSAFEYALILFLKAQFKENFNHFIFNSFQGYNTILINYRNSIIFSSIGEK